jgi:hypothetical protein
MHTHQVKRVVALVGMVALVGCTASTIPASTTAPPATALPPSAPPATPSASPPSQGDPTIDAAVPRPGSIVAAFDSVWVSSRTGSIWRIAPDGRVLARIADASRSKGLANPFRSIPNGLDAGFGSVWSLTDDAMVRIDPASNRIVARIPIALPSALDVGEGAVWVVCCESEITLLRIDPTTMRAEMFADLGTSLATMSVGDGYVWWIRSSEGGGMDRVDPQTGEAISINASYNDQFVVPTPRWIWLINHGAVQRLDTSGSIRDETSKRKADDSIGASYTDGTLWINDGGAIGIDARSGTIEVRIPVFTVKKGWPGGIAQLGNRVWLADPEGNRVLSLSLD